MSATGKLHHRAKKVYKELLKLAVDYPDKSYNLAGRTRECFRATRQHLRTIDDDYLREEALATSIAKAIYIRKEVQAFIFLTRYRELKRRYGDTRHSTD